MKLSEVYKIAVDIAIKADPRGEKEVKKILKELKKDFDKMDKKEKLEFDKDTLFNPYNDLRILNGNEKLEVKKVMAAWDVDVAELLLADRLNEKGKKIDLVIAHHPLGKASVCMPHVMNISETVVHKMGVPVNVAEGILSPRLGKTIRAYASYNHEQVVDAAKLLNIPLMCNHTGADNLIQKFLEDLLVKYKPTKLGEIFNLIKEIPECKMATKNFVPPEIYVGSESSSAGKIIVDMTGATALGKSIYPKLADAGVGTIINMHMSSDERDAAAENYINAIMVGHAASDSLGMNLFLDELEKNGVEILPAAGLLRYSRVKKKTAKKKTAKKKVKNI